MTVVNEWGSEINFWTVRNYELQQIVFYEYIIIKTHGSESWGQERANRITKNKTRNELLSVFYTSKRFCNMML